MTEYKLCDHMALDYDKKMTVTRNEKLWVELDDKFVEGFFNSWVHDDDDDDSPKVKIDLKVRFKKVITKEVEASKVAKAVPFEAMCSAGTRVFTKYKINRKEPKWGWGTLATFPIKEYKFQYLVFFDDGAVSFVRPKNIYMCIVQPKNPSSDQFSAAFVHKYVAKLRQAFIKEYFSMYPHWPMMKLEPKTSVVVNQELGKKKSGIKTVVIHKDRCMLLVRYQDEIFDKDSECDVIECTEHHHRDEWIFAGDTMKIPTLKQIMAVS